MKLFCLIGIAAAAAMLSDCGGSQSQLAPPAPFQQSGAQPRLGQLSARLAYVDKSGAAQTGAVAMHPDHNRSWMAPGATTKGLLYISNYYTDDVLVFSYPQDKLAGTLTGLEGPDGLCADKKGDVWIVNNNLSDYGEDAVEYKHGGTKPIATLEIDAGFAVTCSVDPTTGNLAATTIESYGSGPGSVAIFAHAKGSPKLYYTIPDMETMYFCAYDDKGNLFVDGEKGLEGGGFEFAELPKGKTKFTNIALKGATINYPGSVGCDGKYVTVGDQEYPYTDERDQSAIYQTTGAGGKIVGVTVLTGSDDVEEYVIDGKTVIGPDVYFNDVGFYKYPAGGKPTKTFKSEYLNGPHGAALSQ